MRIAMIAPLVEAVPPQLYGGTERVVSMLTEELVARGHQVTLFASGDSVTAADLVASTEHSLRLDSTIKDYLSYSIVQLADVFARRGEFDIIHNHADYLAFPFAMMMDTPMVSTTHGRLDLPETQRVYKAFDTPLVAISESQRASLNGVHWLSTVYNAVAIDHYHFQPKPGDYLVFLGRICPEKRPDRAIEIARDVGMKLLIAAKVDPMDRDYYEQAIRPLIDWNRPLVEYVGEVDEVGKDQLLGGAYANVFPIDWPEPFGLTMAESMATGTPVIAFHCGSVSEVVEDGVTGFCSSTLRGMIEAVPKVADLDRRACRERVERLFSPKALADGYERAYALLQAERRDATASRRLRPERQPRPEVFPSPALQWGNRTANYLRSWFQAAPGPMPQPRPVTSTPPGESTRGLARPDTPPAVRE
jgi:glycosyltransferase involved in cell wall biosynthesis